MKYFVPSKTFLVGEYSVLVGGSAIGLATQPCFEISYLEHSNDFTFHEKSPAGRYLKQNQKNISVHLYDPYVSKAIQGGFGKSTAEYFSVLLPDLLKQKKSIQEIHQSYLDLFQNEVVKPSGVDLIFQYLGHVVVADLKTKNFYSTDWKLKDLDFFIVSTGLKILTHEHLESLSLEKLKSLPEKSDLVIQSYLNQNSDEFLFTMTEWVRSLKQFNLTHHLALEFQESLQKVNHVLLVKPCGALGGDVMLVFFKPEHREIVETELRQSKIKIQARRENLTEGLIHVVG